MCRFLMVSPYDAVTTYFTSPCSKKCCFAQPHSQVCRARRVNVFADERHDIPVFAARARSSLEHRGSNFTAAAAVMFADFTDPAREYTPFRVAGNAQSIFWMNPACAPASPAA